MYDVIIIGAGASGLMAARELAKAGKKALILEARDRIGGRIYPLDAQQFGYPAQGGAEFVHGEAPITRRLIEEAGLHFVAEEGDIWSSRNGALSAHRSFIQGNDLLKAKLDSLKEDMPIARFLREFFPGDEHSVFRNSVIKTAEGYDAADPERISTLTLAKEWLRNNPGGDIHDGWIKEGYGALLDFLKNECSAAGAEIRLNMRVRSIDASAVAVSVRAGSAGFSAQMAVVTVPLPVLKEIDFKPGISDKIVATERIGFGAATKLVIRFKSRWWEHLHGHDMTKMAFLTSNEPFLTWWTQYPDLVPVMVGWMAGPAALEHAGDSPQELLDMAIDSLARVLTVDRLMIDGQIEHYEVVNWQADPFTRGSYSYTAFDTNDAYDVLRSPVADKIYFAGEAAYSGQATATVEGALGSGQEVARNILEKKREK